MQKRFSRTPPRTSSRGSNFPEASASQSKKASLIMAWLTPPFFLMVCSRASLSRILNRSTTLCLLFVLFTVANTCICVFLWMHVCICVASLCYSGVFDCRRSKIAATHPLLSCSARSNCSRERSRATFSPVIIVVSAQGI